MSSFIMDSVIAFINFPQNKPMTSPVSTSISTSKKPGRVESPGTVMISPHNGYKNPAKTWGGKVRGRQDG